MSAPRAIALSAAVAVLAAGSFSAQQAPAGDLSEVRRLINAGEPRQALQRLQELEAGERAGSPAQAGLLRGVARYHADDPAGAVDALDPILADLPEGSIERREAEQVLGLALFVTGRFREAIPRLEATRRWAPSNLELAYALGQAYVQTHRPDASRGVLADVYGVPPDSAAAHLLNAQAMIRLEMEELAEGELRKAIAADPRLPNAHFLLGQIALFRGRLDEAVDLTRRELEISPGHAMALSQLGDAYSRLGKVDEAIAALQKSIWSNPYYSAPYLLLGRAYMKKGDAQAAEGMLRRAIQYDPNNRAAHYVLGQLLQTLGRTEEAARELGIAERLTSPRGR